MSALTELYQQINLCHKCDIARLRTKVVPGEGAENAEIMFIGEAPGWHEDQQGRPFVGQAGQFLDKLLTSINLDRRQVYIANVIKCRPPDNRDPLPTEIQNCSPWLDSQIEIIKPKMIVTLGRYSMARYFGTTKISSIHGQAKTADGRLVVAMFHPAAALHQPALKQSIEEDFRRLPALIEQARKQAASSPPPPPPSDTKQLSLF